MEKTYIILYRQFMDPVIFKDHTMDLLPHQTKNNIVAVVPFEFSNISEFIKKLEELHKVYFYTCYGTGSGKHKSNVKRFINCHY